MHVCVYAFVCVFMRVCVFPYVCFHVRACLTHAKPPPEFAISPNATISAVSGPLAHGLVLRDRYVSVTVTITNTGAVEGSTPIMVTFSKTTRLVIRYLRQLVGFTKVELKPGESANVDIPLKISDFARYDPRVTWKVWLRKGWGGRGNSTSRVDDRDVDVCTRIHVCTN